MSINDPALRPEVVGRKLKDALQKIRQSPNWLSEQTGIGVSTIYSILNGHQLPSIDKLRRICGALDMSIDWLFEMESNALYLFPPPGEASRSYANFEEFWLGEKGGERICLTRCFSIVNQPRELRRQVIERIHCYDERNVEIAMQAFNHRREVMDRLETRRLEIVVHSEIEDFISQRPPWDRLDFELIEEFVLGIIGRLTNSPLRYEMVLLPRQAFIVNYEIINREVILFEFGKILLRQHHREIISHFLREVEGFQRHPESITGHQPVIDELTAILDRARRANVSSTG